MKRPVVSHVPIPKFPRVLASEKHDLGPPWSGAWLNRENEMGAADLILRVKATAVGVEDVSEELSLLDQTAAAARGTK